MPMPMPMPVAVQIESLISMPDDETPMSDDENLTSDDESPMPNPMPDESLIRRPTLPQLMDFRDQSWLDLFPLDRNVVFDYFALSPFYDRTCNNETLWMNSINPLDASRLSTMTGMEYQMTEVFENELFVFTKQRRDGPDSFTPIISYYVRDGTIHMGHPHSNAFPCSTHLQKRKKEEVAEETVFPCVLKIMPNAVFSVKEHIILVVEVRHGIAKVGTPICIPQKDFIDIGRIVDMKNGCRHVCTASQGEIVAVKIVRSNPDDEPKMFGTHFGIEDELVSSISGESIRNLTKYFRDDLSMVDWAVISLFKALLVKT